METVVDRIRRLGKQSAAPSNDGAIVGQVDEREQAIVDRHTSKAPDISVLQKVAKGRAELEIEARKQQRAYAEKPPTTLAQITVDPAKEMIANLGDRAKVLDTIRKMSPEQREEALRLAPGIAQQLGDDRGGVVGRTLGAVSRGISHGVSQPIQELIGLGGTPDEIEYIRQLDAAASQEFAPARPGDPWYQSGPLQAAQMAPWMATVVGGAGIGRAGATALAGRVAARGAAGGKIAGAVTQAGQVVGKTGLTAGKAGELAGTAYAAFPGQYAQEVDQLKAIGMQDGTSLRLLAGGTAAITGLIEGVVPNPFKAGPVPLTEGAVKAARQYLWNAAKQAPGEMTEEYLQGVTSGLGEHVAQYIDSTVEDRSIGDAFRKGWDQAKEAALPMAFLLGVPAVGGAGMSAARAQQLQQALAKGFVSEEDAKQLGIEGKNRKERLANANKQLEEELKKPPTLPGPPQLPGQPPVPPQGPPSLPGAPGATQVTPPPLPPGTPPLPPTPPLPQGAPNASQVPTNEGSNDVQGDGGKGSQVDSGSQVRQPGQDQGGTKPTSQEPATQEVQVAQQLEQEFSGTNLFTSFADDPSFAPARDSLVRELVARGRTIDEANSLVDRAKQELSQVQEPPKQVQGEVDENQARIFKDGKWRNATVTATNEGDAGWKVKHVKIADPETGQYEYVPFPGDAAKGYSSYEQARDDVLGVLKEKYKEPPAIAATPEKPAKPAKPVWDVVKGKDGKLYRQNPDPNLTPKQKLNERVAVDPSEGVVLVTKDQWDKPISPETLKARQEFADGAQEGVTFRRPGFNKNAMFEVGKDGKIYSIESTTKRQVGTVQELANQIEPGDVTELTKPTIVDKPALTDTTPPEKTQVNKPEPKALPSEMTDEEKDAEVDKLFKPKSEPPKTIDQLRKFKFDDVSDSEQTEGVGKNKGVTYRRKTYEVTNEDGKQHRYKVTINDRDNELKIEDAGRTKEQEAADYKAEYESLSESTKQRMKDIGLDDLSDYQKYDVGLFIEGRTDGSRGSERSVNVILGGASRIRQLMDAMGRAEDKTATWQDVYDFLRKPTQPSADQVNVDSGEESKVKPDAEKPNLSPIGDKTSATETAQSEFDDAALKALEDILQAEQPKQAPAEESVPTGDKTTPKAKSGQYALPGMPGMAAEIDRQDFVRRYRDKALEPLWGWSDDPADAQKIQDAIDTMAPSVSALMNDLYAGKFKDIDEVYDSEAYDKATVAASGTDMDARILNDLDSSIKQAIENRPKPRTVKKPLKSEQTLADAKSDMQAAHDAAAKLMEKIRGKLMSGVDPTLMAETVQVAYLYTKANIKTFKGYVEAIIENFGESFARELAPYMEAGWRALHTKNVVQDPAGKVEDYLTEVSDETTIQSKPGAERNEAVGDGTGKPQGDAATTDTATDEQRDAAKDAGQPGDSILPDSPKTTRVDGRNGGTGSGADGDTNADQSEQGSGEAADTGSGSPDGAMDERLAVNHVIGANDDLAVSSLTQSLARNIKALEILKVLEKDGRFPDEAERKALAQYTGWGGLSQALDSIKGERMLGDKAWLRDESWEKKWGAAYRKLKDLLTKEEFQAAQDSTENAHYTSKPIIQSIWKIAERLGYNGGRVLELGAGIGHFAGLTPSRVRGATQFTMVERDSVSSRIVKMLYPNHEVVEGDMEDFKAVPGSVTLGIGNVPFAGGTVGDSVRRYNEQLNLHNYSIARHLDAVAPGGIVVVVSSHSTLDANIKQRKFLATKGELIGAIRLPNNAFAENAKTEVVTDILIFRRPRQGDGALGVRFDQNVDVKVKNKDGEELSRSINKYFADNPEMVLGKHSAKGSMYGPDEYTVESTPGDLQAKLDAAIENLPRDLLGNVDVAEKVVESDKSVPFGRLEVHAGKVVMGFGDKFVPIAGKKFAEFPVHLTGKTGVSRAKDYIELRDLLADVRSTMLDENATDEAVKRAQRQLAASYDRYVAKHGPLNTSKTNVFKRDPDYYRVLALENERAEYNPETKKIEVTYTKAAIFTDRVLGPQREPDKADSPADAMSVSIAWRGAIDSVFIGKLLGVSTQEAESKLLDEGLAFRNPATTELELADLYLSGNVRAKLNQAEISAEEDAQYKRNVEALTKVLPKPVTIKKDTVRLGATWIPEQVVNAFATKEFGTDVQVSYNANTDAWSVGRVYGISETAKSKYETGRIDPDQLLAEVLNLRSIKIYDQVETGEYTASGKPKTTQTLNEKETQAAKHRASVLRAEFEKWVLGNPEVTQVLAKLYNDKYNNFVRTKYNGDFLVLPGANPEVKLRPYQKDAIWRIINRGTSLLAHAVGAGKTYTMIGAAMEMRRLGLARRPLLVVQNATLGQFATSFQQMYPNANVLVADKNDLGKGKRQLFLNKISTGNWDAVVMAQSTFDNMASDPDVERAFIQDQLDLLEEAIREEGGEGARTPTVKQLVRTKKSLKARFDKLMGSRAKKEDNVTFEELGADALFLDEAHAYKKPTFTTKLSQLVGLNVEASARSLATTIKVRSIQSAHNGRNVILATGTPVTNTLGEAWHMVNYVSPATNADFSSRTFDQFIGNFAQVEPTLTMNAGGQYVYKDAIVKFRNGHQLVEYINDSWDIVTPDALRAYMASSKKGFPELRGGQPSAITVDRTPGVAVFMDFISQVYAKYKGLTAKERRELSFIPALAYGASKAATLDIRLVIPNAAEEKNSKLQKAAEEIKRIYDESTASKGAQLFFSDMKNPFSMSRLRQFMGGETIDAFAEETIADEADAGDETAQPDDNESGSFLYQELRKKLLGMGIPKEQIAFISDAKTDKQRQALFERVNNGDIRILIGSTAKMGIGVNVQKKLVALHHFDTPWLPADLEQREGRILRFANENETVDILRYAMKKTLDGAIYMATARKQKFIWQVLNGQLEGDSFEDPSSAAMLSIEEQLAAIQDDPVFFEKIEIQNRLREMELERQSFYDAQQRLADSLSREKFWLNKEETDVQPKWQRRLDKVEKLQAIKDQGGLETFSLTYGNQTFDDPKKAAEFIKDKVEAISKYVVDNHDRAQSFDKAGGLLTLGNKQKIEFEIGPAKIVIGAEPRGAFVESAEGKTVTEYSARVKSIAYLQEPGGRYEFYDGTATTPKTFFDKMQSLPEEAKTELNRSEAAVIKYREKIVELEGLLGKQWEDQAEYDAKKERLAEIEGQMLASKGNLATEKPSPGDQEGDGGATTSNISPNVVQRTSVAAGTPQQSSRADFSFTEAQTPEGKQLLNKMKRDSVKRKIGPRSIMNFLYDVVRAGSITGKSQLSGRNPGHYKPREHLARTRTGASGVIDTHEAGHALSAILRDVDKKILKRHEAELVALTYMPNSMASAKTAEEGMAEFVRRYIVDYQSIPETLRKALEADIEMVSPELLAGLKDTNRLWQQFLSRPLQERLDASKNDRQPRKIGRGFRGAVYRSLYNLIGGDVAIHKVRRELERPLFQFSQALGREFRDKATDTQADIDNAYQSVIRVPVETQRAIFGDTRSEQQGVSIIAFGDNMFSDEATQYLRDGGFKVPSDFKHGERVYLTNQSFEQIREKLGDDWDAFENYGQLRASVERAERKGHQSAWMHENVSLAEAKQAVADMENSNPKWLEHFDEVREFFDGLLLVATLSGEYTPTEAVRIRNAWDSYWPLLRQVTPEESSRVGRGGPDPAAGVHRAFGSALPLRNLLEAVEMRTKAAMQAYYTNRMMLAMRKYSDTLHAMTDAPFDVRKAGARLMVPLKMDLKKAVTLSPEEQAKWIVDYMNEQLREEARDAGVDVDPDDLYTVEDVAISMPWRPIFRATRPGAIQVVGLTENGQRKYYQVTDPLLFDLFSNSGSMDRYATWLARFFAKGIGPWKRALTQNLAFAIRNAVRDPITGSSMGEGWKAFLPGIYTAYGIVGRLNGSLGKDAPARAELFSRSLEALHHPRHKKLWDSFKEAATEGILVPGYMDMNFYDRVSEAPGQLSAAALWPVTMFNWATGGRYISQMSEELQREGAFIEARGRGKSYEYAQRQYDQISGNFSQRQPNHAIATFVRSAGFLNPGLQIWWGQVKRWTDPDPKMQQFHRAKLPALAAWFSVSSAINIALVYALFGDDKEKLEEVLNDMRERPDYEQDTTMSVMGTVRLPFEYGLSGAVASFAWNSTEDALLGGSNESIPTRLRAFLARAVQVPGPTDAIHPYLKTAIELNAGEAGYSMYRHDSIVPEQLIVQYPVNPELRAYDDTPALFKKIGESASVSPLKVEYAVGSLLTGTASDLIALGGKIAGKKSLKASDFPILSRLIQRESTGFRSQAVRELRKANQEVRAMGVKIKDMGDDAPQELLDKHAKLQEVSLAYDVVSKMYDNVQTEVEKDSPDRSVVTATERQMTRFARQFLNYQAGKALQPTQLKERKHEYYGEQAYDATGSPESEKGMADQEKAAAALKLSGLTLEQAKEAFNAHWTKPDKSGKKNPLREEGVLKDAVAKRYRKLEELFKTK